MRRWRGVPADHLGRGPGRSDWAAGTTAREGRPWSPPSAPEPRGRGQRRPAERRRLWGLLLGPLHCWRLREEGGPGMGPSEAAALRQRPGLARNSQPRGTGPGAAPSLGQVKAGGPDAGGAAAGWCASPSPRGPHRASLRARTRTCAPGVAAVLSTSTRAQRPQSWVPGPLPARPAWHWS